uniref:ATP-dependent RNA helicase n=1 Tax=Meloidogyne incognita TaxID=6306 RepID=A0A914KZ32_MELIC
MDLCNFKRPTPIQKYVLPALIRGNKSFDLIGVAETGSGKLAIFKKLIHFGTAAFLIPLINHLLKFGKENGGINYVETGEHNKLHYTPSALILSPTMELTVQLYKEVLKLTYRTPIVPAYVHGGKGNYDAQFEAIKAGCHILIATPLRLLEMMVNKDIIMTKCNFLVIDEIDQMLDTGFIPQVKKIEKKLPDKIQRTTAMFSATFEEKLKQLASSFLRDNYIKVKITRNIPPYLKHEILWIDDFDKDDKLKELLNDLLNDQGNKIIVFANTKDRCNRIAEFLGNENFKVLLVHGNLSAVDRLKNLRKFVEGKEIKILIASDVLSRGTDIKDISHVINYDSPEKLTTYIHRVGRTARMGKEGKRNRYL